MKKNLISLTILLTTVFIGVVNAQSTVFTKSNIDLSHWKVTLPDGTPNPYEVECPELLNYNTNPAINKNMYLDSLDGGIVFFATPSSVTRNTKYTRCELREQLVPGDDNKNWTFKEGGRMKGTLKIEEISKKEKFKYDKVIVMQIHGRLSMEDRDRIRKKDNDAPPILKVYWSNGSVRLVSKVLRKGKSGDDILYKDAWTDAKPYVFPEKVNFNKFTLELIAEKKKLTVILNNKHRKVYDSKDIKKWGVFQNYFKAGNYLGTNEPDGFAKVKYYDLKVTH